MALTLLGLVPESQSTAPRGEALKGNPWRVPRRKGLTHRPAGHMSVVSVPPDNS